MEHIAAFLLMVTCSNGMDVCEEVPAPQVAYETVQDCEADLQVRTRMQDVPAPRLYSTCVAVDPANFEEDMTITWDVNAAGQLLVEVEPDTLQDVPYPMVAELDSNSQRPMATR